MKEPLPDAERATLERRARTLARPVSQARDAGPATETLVFTRAGARFGVDAVSVDEALPPAPLTLLPGARPFLAGAIQHRGRILAVFDLGRLLGLASPDGAAASVPGAASGVRVVVVRAHHATFGLQADEVSGVVGVDSREAAPGAAPGAAIGRARPGWLRAATADMVSVVDVDALARDPRVTVNDE